MQFYRIQLDKKIVSSPFDSLNVKMVVSELWKENNVSKGALITSVLS